MREFRDDQGRPWMVALTVAAADRVRGMVTLDVADDVEQPDGSVQRQTRQVPFDLIDAGNISRTLEVLRSQYGKIGEVLYAICRGQCEEKKITREQWKFREVPSFEVHGRIQNGCDVCTYVRITDRRGKIA